LIVGVEVHSTGSTGINLFGASDVTFDNILVTGNGQVGLSIGPSLNRITVINSRFFDNGTGISTSGRNTSISNVIAANNSLAGIDHFRSSATITNCNLIGNLQGLRLSASNCTDCSITSDTVVINTIFADNTLSAISANLTPGSTLDVTYSDFNNNLQNGYDLLANPTNVSYPPLFVDTSSEDPLEWDLHLNPDSGLINAGDPDILDPDDSQSDIGAYGGPLGESWSAD